MKSAFASATWKLLHQLALCVLCSQPLLWASSVSAQTGPVPLQQPMPAPANRSLSVPSADDDEFQRNRFERLQRIRAKDRQKRMVDDANRLVQLTETYRKALEAHGTPTAEDQKLLIQIEKLAREVKDRMSGM